MTEQELDAIRERAAKATPGPWHYIGESIVGVVVDCNCPMPEDPGDSQQYRPETLHESHDIVPPRDIGGNYSGDDSLVDEPGRWDQWIADCQFIAHARDDVPALINQIEKRDGIIHDLQQESAAIEAGRQEERRRIIAVLRARERHWTSRVSVPLTDKHLSKAAECHSIAELLEEPLDSNLPPPDRVRAENVRLREALQRIAEGSESSHTQPLRQIAREALGMES
jgi:hypothetical protein